MLMSNSKVNIAAGILLVLAACNASLSNAQASDQKALERAQAMLRQLNSEKTVAEQKLASLQKEYDDYKKETEKKLDSVRSQKDKVSNSLENWQSGYNDIRGKYQELQFELIREKQWAADLDVALETQTSNFQTCKTNNQELADISNQLIDMFEGKGFVDLVKEREAFTGIKRVQLENFVQDKRYEIIDRDLEKSAFTVQPVAKPEKSALPTANGG